MKNPKTLRIPRKLKKRYKKLWEKRSGRKYHIIKNSIEYAEHEYSNGKKVWACVSRTR